MAKESLACLLNGHRWNFTGTRGRYLCKFCSAWSPCLSYNWQGQDVTVAYFVEESNDQ